MSVADDLQKQLERLSLDPGEAAVMSVLANLVRYVRTRLVLMDTPGALALAHEIEARQQQLATNVQLYNDGENPPPLPDPPVPYPTSGPKGIVR